MLDTLQVFGVAILGGAVASVLGPLVSHLLNQQSKREAERVRLLRHLRHMVESELWYGRSLFGALAAGQLQRSFIGLKPVLYYGPVFRPERIEDRDLRNLMVAFEDLCGRMGFALRRAEEGVSFLTDEVVLAWVPEMMDLEKQIVTRMDHALKWPVAESD